MSKSKGTTFVSELFTGQKAEMKICKKCGTEKSIHDFYQHKGHKNRINICKKCHAEKNKIYQQIFLEKHPDYNKIMNKKHRKRKTELQKKYNEVKKFKQAAIRSLI